MTHNEPEYDPESAWEEAGMPDLSDDTQDEPIPGHGPSWIDRADDTPEDDTQSGAYGRSLDSELAEEEPDFGARREEPPASGNAADPADAAWSASPVGGRLVAEDQGLSHDEEKDLVADDVGPDHGGFTAEESAVRIEDEGSQPPT